MLYVDTSALIAYFTPVHSVRVETILRDASRYPLAISE